MAKFSVARVPYYIFAAAFCGAAFVVEWLLNDDSTGAESLFHLGLTVAYGLLGIWSLAYIFIAKHGDDDEVGVDVAGLPMGKGYFYLGLLVGAIYRAVTGLIVNTKATGIESSYGKIWLVAAIVLSLFTWANYRSFQAKSEPVKTTPRRA